MEIPDSREQVKIWQRTRPLQPPVTEGLQTIASAALTAAAVYGNWSQRMQGPQREMLITLREQQIAAARCLKGIYRMATGVPLQVVGSAPANQTMDAALRMNYGRSLKALRSYESRCTDQEYGAVFETLAMREREHCRKIAELMGMLQV